MMLDKFILDNLGSILHEWEVFAKTIDTTTRHVGISELQNDAKKILIEISKDIVQVQSFLEQVAKSKGLSEITSTTKNRPAWNHGFARLQQGYNISEVISEYRALRASVTKLWQASSTTLKSSDFNEIVRFNEAIDQALFESIASYTESQKNQARLFESMLSSYPDLCYTLNLKGEFLYINQAMTDLYKKPSHEILGTTIYHVAMPATVHIHAHIQSIIDTGERCFGYVEFQKPSGQDCFLEYVYAPILDENGQVEAVAALEHDITINKKIEEKFKGLVEATPDSLVVCDQNGQIILVNKLAEKLFGYTRDELYAKKIECLMPNRYRTKHAEHRQGYFKKPHVRTIGLDLYAKHKDGHEFPVEINLSPLESAEGLLALATIRDLTGRRKIEQSHLMMSTALHLMDNAVIGVDLQKKVIIWNKGAENLYGYLMAEAIGQSIDMIIPKEKKGEVADIFVKLANGEHIVEYETLRIHKNGKIIPVSVNVGPVFDAQGKPIGGVGVMRDITQQKEKEDKLKYIAEHDELTGLINRAFFEDRITQAVSLTKRQKSNMAVCFIDLDDFKNVNDVYGHAVGDLVLCAATSRMQKYLRDMDTLARLGGDEFSLILMDVKNEKDVTTVIKKLMNGFLREFLIEGKHLMVTVSIGISLYPKDGDLSLIEKADVAMYHVKKHGKNNFKFYDDKMKL